MLSLVIATPLTIQNAPAKPIDHAHGPLAHGRELSQTIYQAQSALPDAGALVQMGHLAASMHVVPGTATTMVKALADAGLAHYEPYVGVRLTTAGEKLATLVLRRHRLIELFLVKVMDMSWTEVHDEAENLEHAASDRLIARMDEMLGRPDGRPARRSDSWARRDSCRRSSTTISSHARSGRPVTVSRLSDQDRDVPQFAEQHDLQPGRCRPGRGARPGRRQRAPAQRQDRRFTIGARAASKVLVHARRGRWRCCSASRARAGPESGFSGCITEARAVQDHRQLLSRRGSVQPGGGRGPEHLRHVYG